MITLRILGGVDLGGLDTAEARKVLRQPKRMALLAYLALASRDGFQRRDGMLAMFWPEMDEARARRGLRQSLHVLRGALGADAFERRGDDEIALNAAAFRCDAAEVEALLDAGQLDAAFEIYRGDLLPGFHLDDVPQFERWLDDARARLRSRVADAAQKLSEMAEARGDDAGATAWALRAVDLVPDNERFLRRLLTRLDREGDRTGALRTYAEFASRLREDLDVDPAPETQAIAAAMRGANGNGGLPVLGGKAPAATDDGSIATAHAGTVGTVGKVGKVGAVAATLPVKRNPWLVGAVVGTAIVAAAAAFFSTNAGRTPPDVSPAALVARARAEILYDEGMRALTQGDRRAAERLMRRAVDADSTMALALLQLGHMHGLRGEHVTGQVMQTQAVRLATAESDHDRLLVVALYADHFQQTSLRAVAETLAIRYPDNVEGQLLVAKARRSEGAYLASLVPLRRVLAIARDSGEAPARCHKCEAYGMLVANYESADSMVAAERSARAWIAARPTDADAWTTLAYQLGTADRYQEALAALHRAEDLRPGAAGGNAIGEVLLRAGDFRTLNDILQHRIRTGGTDDADDARFLLWRSLREQGRRREALELANAMSEEARTRPAMTNLATYMRAQSLLEAERFAESASIWDSLSALRPAGAEPRSSAAGTRAARLAHLSAAVAGLGDEARLGQLADSVRAFGAVHGSLSSRRLHHFVRGQQLAVLGRDAEACAELQASLFSATTVFVRANLATGRLCLRSKRPDDALRALRGVLRGPIGAGGTYGTLTEAHHIAAQAFEMLGQRDSARVHYLRVAEAWKDADPPERERARAAVRSVSAFGALR